MNGLEPAESHWTFGQIFAMINLFSLANMLLSQAKPRILWTAKKMVTNDDGETDVRAISIWIAVVITLLIFIIIIRGWKYIPEWIEPSDPKQILVMLVVWVFGLALMLSLGLVTAAQILVEWSNSTTSPTFGAIVKSCSLVFRPFRYALGIIEEEAQEEEEDQEEEEEDQEEEEAQEEETGSTLNQGNV
jgi:uncharacterized protein YacL